MWATVLSERAPRVLLFIVTVICVIFALQYAQNILAPMVFALVLGIVFSPLADKLSDLGVPRLAVSSGLLVLSIIVLGTSMLLIEPMVNMLIEELPRIKVVASGWIDTASGVLRGIETISKEIEESVGAESVEPQAAIPSVSDALWLAPSFVSQVFIFIGTLFFFVLTRNDLYQRTGGLETQLRKADRTVSKYFAAVTLVNAGLGFVTAAVLMAVGVEYAMLWGLAAGVLNFILYLGPMMIVVGLTIAGMIQFYGAMAFLPPVLYLMINFMEANFVTPMIVGKRLKLNPLVVFVAIVFGLWLWGPIGAIVALPTLLWLSVMIRPELLVASDETRSLLRA